MIVIHYQIKTLFNRVLFGTNFTDFMRFSRIPVPIHGLIKRIRLYSMFCDFHNYIDLFTLTGPYINLFIYLFIYLLLVFMHYYIKCNLCMHFCCCFFYLFIYLLFLLFFIVVVVLCLFKIRSHSHKNSIKSRSLESNQTKIKI